MKRKEIQQKIKSEIELLASKSVIDNDYNIFSNGYLDSLNVLHILIFIETTYNIKINSYDISIDSLNSINKIVDFIENKLTS